MAEEATQKQYHEVPNGFYDCVLTGWGKRTDKSYGRDATPHYIVTVGLRKADDPDAQMFFAEIPLVFKVGLEWGFWNDQTEMNEVRKTTAKDTADAIEYARKCFPAWAEFVDALPEGTKPSVALGWFGSDASVGATCRAKLKNRSYEVDGEAKVAHEARVYEVKSFSVMTDDFDATFSNALTAAKVKFGKAAKSAAQSKAKTAAKSAPVAPSAPAAPSDGAPSLPPPRVFTNDDAWKAYADHRLGHGYTKEQYWGEVAKAVGKPASAYKTYTSKDWEKCVAAFVLA